MKAKYGVCLVLFCFTATVLSGPEENEGVRYADHCEACKILATELQSRLQETGKSHDVIETGYYIDGVQPKKRTKYKTSELRLIDTLENVCERILQYNIHKERKDSSRFAKGMSQTFQTLHHLVDKGVKVDLGIPYELWDKPSAEITQMKTQCETLIERYEHVIENWYFHRQGDVSLIDYLCKSNVLKGQNTQCLTEPFDPLPKEEDDEQKEEANDAPSKTEL